MATASPPYRLAVEQQLYTVSIRGDIHWLPHTGIIIPMANNIGMVALRLYPSVPHHLMHIVGILGYAHGIGDTTRTIVHLSTPVGIGIREDNLRSTRIDPLASTWTLEPIVIPSLHHSLGKDVHIVVVVVSRLATVQRAVAFLVERIAVLIPILAQTLVTMVFHLPHRVLCALVDVEHLAAILSLIYIEHLTAANGSAPMRVVFVAYGL